MTGVVTRVVACVVTGVVTLSQPRALMLTKHLLESPSTLDKALHDAPWSG